MSASARQIEANRRNAAGPHRMTEEGKQSIRTNAIRHGLATRLHVVLPGEDREFYNEILESLRTSYAPSNTQEEMLVNQIAESYWRLIRARNMENGSFQMGLDVEAKQYGIDPCEPDHLLRGAKFATVLARHEQIFGRISRYEAAAERAYYRAMRELKKLQSTGRTQAAIGPDPLTRIDAPERVSDPPPEIGSVPQSQPPKPAAHGIRSVPQKQVPVKTTPERTFEEVNAALELIDAKFLRKRVPSSVRQV